MQKISLIALFILSVFFAEAQKTKAPATYFTRTSEIYLTDAEVDSLYYEEAMRFLKEHSIPEELVEKTYPAIKSMLQATSQQKITQAFKELEARQKIKIITDKNLPQFTDTRSLYAETFREQIRNTFSASKTLSKYLSLNDNDRITSFNSIVRVGDDGKLLVQENISIYNGNGERNTAYGEDAEAADDETANNEIKRGIVRAFPLYYINKYKLFQNTTFKLVEVLRDGKPENYHTENQENG
ncbi:MAG: hypothetical protein ACKOU7_11625, partial [Ferruginibacter sp.]